ncbi:12S rRNA N(4)-cytidine methyltransferase METTL15 isoform X2 [Bos taurus]|uniref:12S rRNA N(4)-cytidine methyltransferase METTL15 isoform X2 n=1 Tax=Bos taurus TaxID=9913 RepID=UPI0028CBB68E|nr:12S rRNA N4-methylcytidine methyltransferase isoform X2 [Bos taurus]
MLKILQARLQQYMNHELPDVQAGFRKGRGTRDQIANIRWIIEKAREFQKNIYFFFIDYAKAFDCVDHNKVQKILQEMGIPDHLTCLLRNLYAGQEATVRTGHGTTDWFQIGKGVCQGCILSPCLFNFYTEYIMRNAGLEEAQAGIKIAGRNINNLRYADDTTLMADSEEELKSLLMKMKEESEKVGLKFNIQKTKIMASGPISSVQFSSSVMSDSATPGIPALQASLSITNSWNSFKLKSIESVMPSSHLILCCPLVLLPPIPPSIRVFSSESTLLMRWPKYWSFSFNIIPCKEHPGLISFRMDCKNFSLQSKDSQESSPTPQFKSINSSALSFRHSPTLTSIPDYWKNHSLD